jgi:hypothetical protein
MDLCEIVKFGINNEFHMLRHFQDLDESLKNRLIEAGYTQTQINQELELPGSVFFSSFAKDIRGLIARLSSHPYSETFSINGNLQFDYLIDQHEFPNGIGNLGVVSINEIPENRSHDIYFEENRDYKLAHCLVNSLPVTNRCTMILKPNKEGFQFISAFTGPPAMPIPKKDMPLEVFQRCDEFWKNHVFLKVG